MQSRWLKQICIVRNLVIGFVILSGLFVDEGARKSLLNEKRYGLSCTLIYRRIFISASLFRVSMRVTPAKSTAREGRLRGREAIGRFQPMQEQLDLQLLKLQAPDSGDEVHRAEEGAT